MSRNTAGVLVGRRGSRRFQLGSAVLGNVVVLGPVAFGISDGRTDLIAAPARRNGLSRRAAVNIATTVLARDRFSIIIAALAAGAGLDERITPLVALYVLILAILRPLLASRFRPIAQRVPERWFPRAPEPSPSAPG